jgi:heme oxygenase
LSSHLREATAQAHDTAATSFALDARLGSRDAYADLLLCLREFYGPVEAALLMVAGWRRLTPAVEIRSRCRATLLEDDLRSLDIAIPRAATASAP